MGEESVSLAAALAEGASRSNSIESPVSSESNARERRSSSLPEPSPGSSPNSPSSKKKDVVSERRSSSLPEAAIQPDGPGFMVDSIETSKQSPRRKEGAGKARAKNRKAEDP